MVAEEKLSSFPCCRFRKDPARCFYPVGANSGGPVALAMQHDDNTADDAKQIYVDVFLGQLLQLAKMSSVAALKLERLVPVRHCAPCEQCCALVARVRLAGEVRTVDCVRHEFGNPHFPRWNANVLSEHDCGVHR